MSEPSDPGRWSDGVGGPPPLSELLSRAKSDLGSDVQLTELLARVNAVIDAPPPLPGAPTSTLRFWLATGGLIVGLGVGAAVYLSRVAAPTVAPVVSALTPPPPLPETPAAGMAPSAVHAPVAPTSEGLSPLPTAHSTKKQVVAPPTASSAAASEASLLERARSALTTNPAQSFALAQRHAVEFPHGLLVQEREVIAISALRRLGRTSEADARAARFDAHFPKSVHQPVLAVPKRP